MREQEQKNQLAEMQSLFHHPKILDGHNSAIHSFNEAVDAQRLIDYLNSKPDREADQHRQEVRRDSFISVLGGEFPNANWEREIQKESREREERLKRWRAAKSINPNR